MPNKRKNTPEPNRDRLSISYSTIGAIGGILLIVGMMWGVATKIATKADVDSIKSSIAPTLTDHETRIRGIELQLASYFGASRTATPRPVPSSDENEQVHKAGFVLAQYQVPQIPDPNASSANAPMAQRAYSLPPRRVVVPLEIITSYKLEPTRGGSYAVLGQDGKYYSLDDILYVIIEMHMAEGKRGLMNK